MLGWGNYGFQESSSSLMMIGQWFHDYVLLIVIVIIGMIIITLVDMIQGGISVSSFTDLTGLELWWTVLPGVVLVAIAYPSLRLLYLMDEVEAPGLTLNVLGHQWFWEYCYPDLSSYPYESYMLSSGKSVLSLLEVDNSVVLPSKVLTRVLVSASDVIHSWALPELGVKVDAIPGRLNQIGVVPVRSGQIFGQCSEICGANHSFMPIAVEVLPISLWAKLF